MMALWNWIKSWFVSVPPTMIGQLTALEATAFLVSYDLYYLADQNGPIDGDKRWVGNFSFMQEAHDRAEADGIRHYSIEADEGYGFQISYVC